MYQDWAAYSFGQISLPIHGMTYDMSYHELVVKFVKFAIFYIFDNWIG